MNKRKLAEIIEVHGTIILSAIFFLLIILDNVNPAMNFIASSQGKFLLFFLCLFSFIVASRAAIRIHRYRVKKWREAKKAERDQRYYN